MQLTRRLKQTDYFNPFIIRAYYKHFKLMKNEKPNILMMEKEAEEL